MGLERAVVLYDHWQRRDLHNRGREFGHLWTVAEWSRMKMKNSRSSVQTLN